MSLSLALFITPALTTGAYYTLSLWFLQSTNGGPLVIRLSSGTAYQDSVDPTPPSVPYAIPFTPGATNSVFSTLAPIPPLWINEVQANNLTGITNRAGQRAPWLELYNAGTNTLALKGYYLADNYT